MVRPLKSTSVVDLKASATLMYRCADRQAVEIGQNVRFEGFSYTHVSLH